MPSPLRWIGRWLALAGATVAATAATPRQPLTVFAAASLTDALGLVGKEYTRRTGQPVRFSFASSGILARQVEAGAPADLFFSADPEWMNHAQKAGAIQPATRRDLLGNRLVLVAPRASRLRLTIAPGFALARALGASGKLAIGDPGYVPAGLYARTALQRLGVWNGVAGRLVQADNVRTALAYVARGEAPLGIVYESDAAAEPAVRVIDIFPAASYPPIVYPAALSRRAGAGADTFLRFCGTAPARAIFARHRFRPL